MRRGEKRDFLTSPGVALNGTFLFFNSLCCWAAIHSIGKTALRSCETVLFNDRTSRRNGTKVLRISLFANRTISDLIAPSNLPINPSCRLDLCCIQPPRRRYTSHPKMLLTTKELFVRHDSATAVAFHYVNSATKLSRILSGWVYEVNRKVKSVGHTSLRREDGARGFTLWCHRNAFPLLIETNR